jgi:CRP-like cAMP-binding protein
MELQPKARERNRSARTLRSLAHTADSGDYVFYEGESGERMYFIKYGKLQVMALCRANSTELEESSIGDSSCFATFAYRRRRFGECSPLCGRC